MPLEELQKGELKHSHRNIHSSICICCLSLHSQGAWAALMPFVGTTSFVISVINPTEPNSSCPLIPILVEITVQMCKHKEGYMICRGEWERPVFISTIQRILFLMLKCYIAISMDFYFIWGNFLSHPLASHTQSSTPFTLYCIESNFSIILFTLTKISLHFKKVSKKVNEQTLQKTTILQPLGTAGHFDSLLNEHTTGQLQIQRPFFKKITEDLIRFFFPSA